MGSMENVSRPRMEDHKFELPPGFRFHPTDEELIIHYLTKKVADSCFCAIAIAEADFNKFEPWDLPGLAKVGETEWYYFCVRDRKYPTGLRTNRATDAGYWKATGKDKEIIMENALIGMRKTLVFYKGRAPNGEKTNWVMHEYRLEGNNKHSQYNLTKPAKSEWVICRVFEKGPCGKKMHIPKFGRLNFNPFREEQPSSSLAASLLPPLMDSSPYNKSETRTTHAGGELSHKTQDDIVDSSKETFTLDFSSSSTPALSNQSPQIAHQIGGNSQYSDCFVPQGQSMLRMMLMENHGSSAKQNQKAEFFMGSENLDADISSVIYNNDMFQRWFGNQEHSSASAAPVDIDCLWNY